MEEEKERDTYFGCLEYEAFKLLSKATWNYRDDFAEARRLGELGSLQSDVSQILRARLVKETILLAEKGTWTEEDLWSAQVCCRHNKGDLLQTDISQHLCERLVDETKSRTTALLSKKTWSDEDLSAAERLWATCPGDLKQTDISKRLRKRLVEETKLRTTALALLSKETWSDEDWSAAKVLWATSSGDLKQTDISKRLRKRLVDETKLRTTALALLSKETWSDEDWSAAEILWATSGVYLKQIGISQRFRERLVNETKLRTKALLSKEQWSDEDWSAAKKLWETSPGDLTQSPAERLWETSGDLKESPAERRWETSGDLKELRAKALLMKETWSDYDWFAAKTLLKRTPEDLKQTDINTQRLRERYEKTIEKFFEPFIKSRLKENIAMESFLKKQKPVRAVGDQWFLDKVREAQKRQRQGTLKTNHDATSADADEMDKVPEEIGDDPYTRRLYTKALQDGKETDRCIRINVVGNFSQGKTTLVRRLVGQSIDGVETTNGIDIDRYRCKESQDGSLYCEKTTNDGNSSALYRLFLIASSLETEKVEHISQNSEIDETLHAHKADSHGQTESPIDFEINDEFLSFLHQIQTETGAEVVKTENEIPATFDIWDFGGQYIFYATHTMFHSRNAIYLLVVDVSRDMDDIILDQDFPAETGDRNMEYFIKFWMNSIHSFVGTQSGSDPQVILVGTHKDEIPGDENEKQQCTEEYFEKVRRLFDNTDVLKHIHSKDFAVDNMSLTDTGIGSLRKEIIKMGMEKAETVQIPAKWIPLEEALHKRRNENIIPFDEVKNIDARNVFPLADEEQIKLFLQYHHSKGTLFYFDEEPVSEYVVVNPQYLIDAFKCIITSERFCKKDPKIRPLWSRLVKEARLENDLIDFQWRRNEDKQFMTNRTILLSLLKKHHIISEVMNFDERCQSAKGLGWYIVPSLLRNRITHTQIDDFVQGKKQTIIRIALRFENSAVIPTICHRLFAAALSRWCVASFHNQLLLFEDFAVFRLDMYQVGIVKMNLKDRAIELQVLGLGRSAYLGDTFRRFTEAVVNHEFRKFNTNEDLQMPYQLCYRCSHKSHGIDGSDLVKLSLIKSKHNIPCPDLENHTLPVAEAKSEWFLEDTIRINDIPRQIPSEKQLSKISKSVGDNWEILGVELGLTTVKIDHLKMDNHTTVDKIFGMLMEWRKQQADRATIDALVEAIKENPQVRIDWDIIRNIIDEMGEK